MGRRKRSQSDEYDDSVERQFFVKQYGRDYFAGSSSKSQDAEEGGVDVDVSNEEFELKRQKKRAKKLRQKEKKLAEKKAEDEKKEAERLKKEQEDKLKEKRELKAAKLKQKRKDNKDFDEPPTNEWTKTSLGVKYCDLELGKGPVIEDRKRVIVKYILRASGPKGKIIDSGKNFSFKMGKGEVIKGWEIGLRRMKQGGVCHIIVPPKAGYGSKDIGGGSGALLYFEVTLIKCC